MALSGTHNTNAGRSAYRPRNYRNGTVPPQLPRHRGRSDHNPIAEEVAEQCINAWYKCVKNTRGTLRTLGAVHASPDSCFATTSSVEHGEEEADLYRKNLHRIRNRIQHKQPSKFELLPTMPPWSSRKKLVTKPGPPSPSDLVFFPGLDRNFEAVDVDQNRQIAATITAAIHSQFSMLTEQAPVNIFLANLGPFTNDTAAPGLAVNNSFGPHGHYSPSRKQFEQETAGETADKKDVALSQSQHQIADNEGMRLSPLESPQGVAPSAADPNSTTTIDVAGESPKPNEPNSSPVPSNSLSDVLLKTPPTAPHFHGPVPHIIERAAAVSRASVEESISNEEVSNDHDALTNDPITWTGTGTIENVAEDALHDSPSDSPEDSLVDSLLNTYENSYENPIENHPDNHIDGQYNNDEAQQINPTTETAEINLDSRMQNKKPEQRDLQNKRRHSEIGYISANSLEVQPRRRANSAVFDVTEYEDPATFDIESLSFLGEDFGKQQIVNHVATLPTISPKKTVSDMPLF